MTKPKRQRSTRNGHDCGTCTETAPTQARASNATQARAPVASQARAPDAVQAGAPDVAAQQPMPDDDAPRVRAVETQTVNHQAAEDGLMKVHRGTLQDPGHLRAPMWQGPPNNPHAPTQPVRMFEDSDSDSEVTPGLDSVAQNHIHGILGTMGPVESVSTPLAAHVPKTIRKKVWSNQYVDFALLLPSDSSVAPEGQKFQLQWDNSASLSLVPSHKSKRITNIEIWTTAFLRFVAIYTQKSPFEAPALMKYCDTIRNLAQRRPGLAFIFYDTQFRTLRKTYPHPWDQIHMEFWLLACTQSSGPVASPVNRPFRNGPYSRLRARQFLRNTCWGFNYRGTCVQPNCPHPHVCGLCRGAHSAVNCYKSKGKPTTANTAQRPSSASNSPNFKPPRS